ncbi:MAG: 30S ribosomal protein S11 [Candidatus Beckwithbacteria bacterium]|nr:30S ribosomal protein S11 [Patescibacteria group bacterium]
MKNNKPTTSTTQITSGKIFITATFNNTLISITDIKGNVICWGSTGASGFKGSRKSTPYAATTAIETAINKAKDRGLSTVQIFIKGPGSGRDAILGVVRSSGLKVTKISDITPIPHNGCRPKKRRRG